MSRRFSSDSACHLSMSGRLHAEAPAGTLTAFAPVRSDPSAGPAPMSGRHTVSLLLLVCWASPAGAADRPNVLFLFSDDQTFASIRALSDLPGGNGEIQTPNLDRLVARGTTFTRCYNMGGYHGAICVASRTMLVTGKSMWRAEKHEPALKSQDSDALAATWPRRMSGAGYKTYFTGKWHVKAKAERLFDEARHVRPGMPNQTPTGYGRPLADGSDPWDPTDARHGGFWKGGTHWSEVVRADAVDYIQDPERGERPFFAYVAFNAPHDPRQSPQEFLDRYPAEQVAVPASFLPEYPYARRMGAGPELRDSRLMEFPRTEYAVRVHRREYYAIITHMDEQIGLILDALDDAGLTEETLICFTSDHGLAVGHHGLVGKQNMYEHSLRVPFIVAGPGVPEGERRQSRIHLQDFGPTAMEAAGLEVPADWEFESLWPLIRGEETREDPIYGAYTAKDQRAYVDGDHKLIAYPRVPVLRLFNLAEDPSETKDLLENPSLPKDSGGDALGADVSRAEEMLRALRERAAELDDPLDYSVFEGLLRPAE